MSEMSTARYWLIRVDGQFVVNSGAAPEVVFPRGAADEFGAAATVDKVHIHDLHATVLALLGFDHTKLTYRYNGRDFRLTDVAGSVVKGIMA